VAQTIVSARSEISLAEKIVCLTAPY